MSAWKGLLVTSPHSSHVLYSACHRHECPFHTDEATIAQKFLDLTCVLSENITGAAVFELPKHSRPQHDTWNEFPPHPSSWKQTSIVQSTIEIISSKTRALGRSFSLEQCFSTPEPWKESNQAVSDSSFHISPIRFQLVLYMTAGLPLKKENHNGSRASKGWEPPH